MWLLHYQFLKYSNNTEDNVAVGVEMLDRDTTDNKDEEVVGFSFCVGITSVRQGQI